MASFLGIGLGILIGRGGRRVPLLPFALLLLGVVWLVTSQRLDVQLRSQDELFFGLAESDSADINFLVLPLLVVLVTVLMAALATPLGPLLRSLPPLRAYAVDICGSLAGIAGFTLLSAAGTDPLVWFGVATLLVLLLELGTGVSRWTVPTLAALALALLLNNDALGPLDARRDVWSPYYRITSYVDARGLRHVNVNGIPHQALHPVDGSTREPFYDQVYRWFPGRTFSRVLVVGAGSGSDVALALARGAEHVDAVEIDPRIQRLGIDEHPDAPYQDPRVRRIVDDGRNFLRGTDGRYDLVIFALPDSLTLVSTTANLRLESFLFTEEAFAAVRDHLADDGVFVLYNYYREPWLVAKLADMLERTFGHAPLLRTWDRVMAALAAGPAVAALPDGLPPGDATAARPDVGEPAPRPASDDWPFLYLRAPFVAPYYLLALGLVLAFAVLSVAFAARASGTSLRRFSPHFFVLGTAFLLLETRSLVSFSLLFGTTWLVNALAFFAILVSVLAAILINARFPVRRPWPFYAGLFVSLALAYLVPPESLLIDPPALRYVLAAALAFAPVFFANLVFTASFRDTRTADMAFASNLLGAMLGGVLEYLALLTGYRALLLLVAALYALAWLFATRARFLADRDLEPAARLRQPGAATAGAVPAGAAADRG
jgi:SAM-dependent methyltransferase